MDPYHHSLSSVHKWGGAVEDYLPIHAWFDATKEHFADFRHRALRHHAQGIAEAIEVFGPTLTTSAGRAIPVRWVGEQHVTEDCGRIPTVADWLKCLKPEPWMLRVAVRSPEVEAEAGRLALACTSEPAAEPVAV